jgi:triosephosphate isomerase (TIM)
MLILNLKTYKESTGTNLNRLLDAAKALKSERPELDQNAYYAPSMIELVHAKQSYNELKIMSQHVDNHNAGSTTGWTPAENVVGYGIEYGVLNHAERRVWNENIVEQVKAIQAKGLKLVVCVESIEEAKTILEANPYGVAYENKDLIGSGRSITQERPDAVKEFIELAKGRTKVIIGAGVSTGEDVQIGLEMGGEGFILASAFVKAQDPVAQLVELLEPVNG